MVMYYTKRINDSPWFTSLLHLLVVITQERFHHLLDVTSFLVNPTFQLPISSSSTTTISPNSRTNGITVRPQYVRHKSSLHNYKEEEEEEVYDNDEDEDSIFISSLTQRQRQQMETQQQADQGKEHSKNRSTILSSSIPQDLTGCSQRQFRIGSDIILTSFLGSLGFDEVTDWNYYLYSEEEDNDEDDGPQKPEGAQKNRQAQGQKRTLIQPLPFDSSKPKRTRSSSGGIIRIFRGELAGRIGSILRSQGMDTRVLMKEFVLDESIMKMMAASKQKDDKILFTKIIQSELESVTKIQSNLILKSSLFKNQQDKDRFVQGEWNQISSQRYYQDSKAIEKDDRILMQLLEFFSMKGTSSGGSTFTSFLQDTKNKIPSFPIVGILGTLNLEDYFLDNDLNLTNQWYKTFGVAPPKPGSVWIVYEYAGLFTLGSYTRPALQRWANLPLQKGFWGNVIPPPPLPSWKDRARYVVQGILKGALEAVAILHENGIAHRSIGRNSILISSTGSDKQEASSPFAVSLDRLKIKLVDFGFSGQLEDIQDEAFQSRARAFQIDSLEGRISFDTMNFAIAEDLHALGLVYIAVLLSSLADIPDPNYVIPPTDEDSLQRLLYDIFDKNMDEFREYCQAEDIWTKVVSLLDENDKAGWELLRVLCFARERAAESKITGQLVTARGLLSSPFFSSPVSL